CQQNNGDPWTF
nr:immunoglobulin light chain junction region [Macaca mulatta]MOW08329.1 immunoglobulin light chain junction region [Macaca mulatta]MOW08583.1 immunoglobulin light chain junction region [Macaca mulatta]MOW09440.1 immunoglobulin light chain junction region [Macaca mulatta]MOW09922.1 immunoglobulin light chain junction region [Macaca mulatta]